MDRSADPLPFAEQERRQGLADGGVSGTVVDVPRPARRSAMSAPFVTVITTIQPPTPSVGRLVAHLARTGGELIVVGDKKGPDHFDVPGARFVPLAEQVQLPFSLAELLPTGHYVRKNLGYLLAFADSVERIY